MKILGLAYTLLVALAAEALASQPWFRTHAIGALTVSILLGMVIGNTVYGYFRDSASAGVGFSRKYLLQLGIVLYGLQISLHDLSRVGFYGGLVDTCVLITTFGLAYWVGKKLLGIDRETSILIGAGSSICGAAAVLATEPVIKSRPEQVAVAVSTVLIFGTASTLLYPVLFHANGLLHYLPTSQHWYGIFAGSTIHEVAQVVAATKSVGTESADLAVITKMIRVMMLAPFLILLAMRFVPQETKGETPAEPIDWANQMPWFALVFIGVIILNSFVSLPPVIKIDLSQLDVLLLSMAMAALGSLTDLSVLRSAGWKPVILGTVLFLWLLIGGGLINAAAAMLFDSLSEY